MAENKQYWNQLIYNGVRYLQEQNNDTAAAVLKQATFDVEHTYHDSWRWGTDYWELVLYLNRGDYTALGDRKDQIERDIMSALVTLQKGSRDLLSTVSIRTAIVQDIDWKEDNMLTFRYATEDDCALILHFINALAEYEKMSDQVVATEDLLKEWIFEKGKAEVIFACEGDKEVGFALFFHNFSTFLGRAGIYLEDLFVLPEYRGKGYGKGLLRRLAQITIERGCGRLEWACLDWNQPSIDFYRSLGAAQMDEWTTYRLTGETLLIFEYPEDEGKK